MRPVDDTVLLLVNPLPLLLGVPTPADEDHVVACAVLLMPFIPPLKWVSARSWLYGCSHRDVCVCVRARKCVCVCERVAGP